ncbi:MAG: hypothetical protein PW844_08050 [Pantoea sp.]|uniref:hypothetical protein n=1 Tax=Pantoea sp. TaxID=69393 RepID=UPI002397393D|nr:hypothetical protein [Pantoea sp.]MDE1186415.1 hypothetical protein [Pantoea sp.]
MEILNTLFQTIATYRYIFWPLFALLALTITAIKWWEQVRYFFLNLFCSLPVIGTISRLARSHESRRPGTGKLIWHPAEEALCGKFYQFHSISNRDADFYLRCVNYLNKVDERGRKPTSVVLWLCSIALVILEAFIFALVLSPFIANNISANQAELSAIVVSVLIGVILVPATHLMGTQLHKNTLLKKIRYWHKEAHLEGNAQALKKDPEVSLENTRIDDDAPSYLQMLNRVQHGIGAKPQYVQTVVTLLLIITFAIGAYFIRAATINAAETQAVNGTPFSQTSAVSTSSPFELPQQAIEDNQQADQQAAKEVTDNRVFASKLTFIILSVIFIGVQLIGILIGYYRSLVGIESRHAAKYVGNFSGSEEFAAWYAMRRERVERDAQDKLASLQNRMAMQRASSASNARNDVRTFDEYVRGKQRDKIEADEHAASRQSYVPSAHVREMHKPEPVLVVEPAPAALTPVALEPNSADDKARIAELGDLTVLNDEELLLVAEDAGLPFEALQHRRKVQLVLHKARGG